MTQQQKENLIKNLFPTAEIRQFLCNDLFEEFKFFLPQSVVLNAKNKNEREQNYVLSKQKIKDFVLNNAHYNKIIFEKLSIRDFEFLIEYLLVGYVFTLSATINPPLDAFSDKRSILFGKMLDFLYT